MISTPAGCPSWAQGHKGRGGLWGTPTGRAGRGFRLVSAGLRRGTQDQKQGRGSSQVTPAPRGHISLPPAPKPQDLTGASALFTLPGSGASGARTGTCWGKKEGEGTVSLRRREVRRTVHLLRARPWASCSDTLFGLLSTTQERTLLTDEGTELQLVELGR